MKRIINVFLLLACVFSVFALEVNRTELQSTSANAGTIEFINYEGPHKIINTIEQIIGIGSSLGKQVTNSITDFANYGNANTYYVIHAVDPETQTKLDADILILGSNVAVDHITNLRRIISGYLIEAYGYSNDDANTLATFITVYNAVYRGNMQAFSEKYKSVVTEHLTAEKVGLSTNYKDWPGQTQIVIPLLNLEQGNISAIDTSVISDSEVIKSMKEEDERGVDERKNMVDIKEREADKATEEAKEAQKEATEAKQELTEAKEELKQAETEKQVAEEKAAETKKEAEADPTNQEKQEAAKEAEQEAEKASEKVAEVTEKVTEAIEKVEEKSAEANKAQSFADKKVSEAQSERTDIASDQQKNIQEAKAEQNITKAYGLKLTDDSKLLSQLVVVNASTGSIVKSSPVRAIRNRTIVDSDNTFIAIAGDSGSSSNEAIRLIVIDKETMEMVAQSNEDVAANAMLVEDSNYLFTVIQTGNDYSVAKYSKDLRLQCQSTTKVNPNTPITVTKDGLAVTDKYGNIALLSKADLSVTTTEERPLK